MNPLNSVKGALTTGVILAVLVAVGLTVSSGGALGFHDALLGPHH